MDLPERFHERLHRLRKDSRLSQSDWCRKCGIPRWRLSKLERGLSVPTPAELSSLAGLCGLSVPELTHGSDWAGSAPRWRDELEALIAPRPARPTPPWAFSTRLRAAEALNGRLFRRYREAIESRTDSLVVRCALRDLWTDGPGEVLAWMDLAGRGALPVSTSLEYIGFRDAPVICPKTERLMGDVPVQCWLLREPRIAFFPQVTVVTPKGSKYRLDSLTCIERGRWVDVEFDGECHEREEDRRRDENMPIPTWRFDMGPVQNGVWFEQFLERLRGFGGLPGDGCTCGGVTGRARAVGCDLGGAR